MAMDRGGTGTSQGSSSNQKGGSGEGSKSSSRGGGSNNRGGWSGGSGSNGGGRSSSSSKGSSSSASAAGSASSKTSSSSSKSGTVGTGKASGNLAGGNGLAGGMSEADQRGAYSAGRAAAQAIGSGSAKASDGSLSAKGDQTGKGGVASRVSSINQTLSSYGAPAAANPQKAQASQSLASAPTGQIANANMSEAEQRAAYSAGAGIARDHGVIANLVNRNKQGIATDQERAQLSSIADSATNHSAATVIGGTVAGSVGSFLGNGLASLADDGGYYSGLGKQIGTGEMKGVLGSINDTFGQGGMADTALGVAANVASAALPGSGLVFNAISNGLKAPNASAIAEINKALGRPVGANDDAARVSGNGNGFTAPPRQSLASTGQSEGSLAFDSSYYDPSRFNVTTGKRGY